MTCSPPITAHLTPRPRHHEPRHAQVVAGAHDGAEVAGVAHAAEDDPDRARGGGGGRGERLVPQRRHVRHDALVHVVLLVPVIIIIIIIIININTTSIELSMSTKIREIFTIFGEGQEYAKCQLALTLL